jgi:hypothetical protein
VADEDDIVRHAGGTIVLLADDATPPPSAARIARFAAHGWHPQLVDSLGMRALATRPWLRRSLIVLRRGDPPEHVMPGLEPGISSGERWPDQVRP